jgi:hypothetical protein
MPKFIKMGLGGTGFLGKQSKHSRNARKFAARRRIEPGFPITTPFNTVEEMREYFSGDRILCLLCGKAYRVIGIHLLKIHNITPDEYRERYRIPWGYGLCSEEASSLKEKIIKRRMEEGWLPPFKSGAELADIQSKSKRETPWKKEIADMNLNKTPSRINPSPKHQEQERNRVSFGSPELRKKQSANALKRRDEISARFREYWRTHEKTPEHKKNIGEALRKNPKKEIRELKQVCSWCGGTYYQKKLAGNQLYCSLECRNAAYSHSRKQEYYGDTKDEICFMCGKEFQCPTGRYKGGEMIKVCSLSCRQKRAGMIARGTWPGDDAWQHKPTLNHDNTESAGMPTGREEG